ncbi:MAG: s-methyl-5-thioribose-1-phosphate isomerase [Anaerolineaceae bacterium]|nr:s-methyl-5-thioribose-1-phosphate isomerase [Anaerolineaceae bacterium]
MMKPEEVNELLPFLLRRENVARYEDDVVWIGNRQKYPFEKEFVRCDTVESVARAIEDMITQGGGPPIAAMYAMAMAAHQSAHLAANALSAKLHAAADRLIGTRPTNTSLARQMEQASRVMEQAIASGQSVEAALIQWIEESRDCAYERYALSADYGASLIDDGDGILTMCFAETAFVLSLALAQKQGKRIHVFTPETRPYLQGARLTAPCVHELGIPVEIIGDNMPAYVLSQGKVQKYFTAADLVTLDGHVVNKVGTFQNAIAAHYHGVPYFVFSWGPDKHKPDRDSIVIEERDPAEMKSCRGVVTTDAQIPAYYPAFDITPPHLVAGIITQHGIISPYDLKRFFS